MALASGGGCGDDGRAASRDSDRNGLGHSPEINIEDDHVPGAPFVPDGGVLGEPSARGEAAFEERLQPPGLGQDRDEPAQVSVHVRALLLHLERTHVRRTSEVLAHVKAR